MAVSFTSSGTDNGTVTLPGSITVIDAPSGLAAASAAATTAMSRRRPLFA